jgi:hypothetical protein
MIMKWVTGVLMRTGLAVLLVIGFISTISFAIEPAQKPPGADPKKLQEPAPRPKTDLRVEGIYASHCKCDLSDVDALYMNEIIVYIGNYPYRGTSGVDPAQIVLRVTYHDLQTGRLETVTKNVSLGLGKSTPVGVVNRSVLVKKSVGVRAEVSEAFAVDSRPANNVKTVRECEREFH